MRGGGSADFFAGKYAGDVGCRQQNETAAEGCEGKGKGGGEQRRKVGLRQQRKWQGIAKKCRPAVSELQLWRRKLKYQLQGALEELKSQDEADDAWDLVKKDEHPGRVRLRGRGVTKTMLQNKNKKIMDPSEQVPESVVQTISQKVEQELTKKFEEQKADLVHGFAELLTETLGQTIDPAAIARLIARTRSPEQGGSARNHDHPRSSASSHQPRNEHPSNNAVESFSQRSNNEEGIYGNSCGVHFDIDAELKSNSLNLQSFGTFQSADRADLYSYKANAGWGYHDELRQDLGSNGFVDELASNLTVISSPTCTEF
ncbi:uncharacterized protein A4U43_C10F9570 [Asparagus officinalis]|uniref:Uncharacterized protein n=1 Tax=Asparagus officinalis TaxID=4686 RepID=A0A5P1E1M1_ASPOF|nr:uncharacterized protein A4U43_C10F9570 [Asparagus officinalis]